MEMSFVEDGEEVRQVMDPLIKGLVTEFAGKKLVFEDFPRMTYQEAMETYGTDKPDLRYDMKLVDLTDDLQNTEFTVFKNAQCVKAICVKDGASLSRSQIDGFTELARKDGAGGLAYLTYKAGEIQSPIVKFLSKKELDVITQKAGAQDGDAVFFGADTREKVNKVLGTLRVAFADQFDLKNRDEVAALWIIDFPLYEWDETTKRVEFGHNPFSMPKGGLEVLRKAKTDSDKLNIVADQYDLVMNGYEMSSGAVRNYHPDIMYEAFGILGYDKAYVEHKFGGLLNAFKFGAPPHAGNAPGIDRIFMLLNDTDNIRDIVPFPKNGSGEDLMMGSPSNVEPEQLKELSIKTV
jgi:aspartyl-tRNA synthetase